MSLIEGQPFKGIYVLYSIAKTLVSLPYILIRYLFPSLRPHRQWTLGQSVRTFVARILIHTVSAVKIRTPLDLTPGDLRGRFRLLEPNPSHRHGVLLSRPAIRSTTIPGVWYFAKMNGERGGIRKGADRAAVDAHIRDIKGPIVLHFHGGAYVVGTARPNESGLLGAMLSQHVAPRVFLPSYRLASNAGCPFPAQLQDAVTAYAYLLNDVGVPPRDVVVSGDSAGGNLALGLLRYLAEEGEQVGLPMPGVALLWSPWLDVAGSLEGKSRFDRNRNAATDYIGGLFGYWGASSLVADGGSGDGGVDVRNRYITPVGAPFACRTPLWFQAGGLEMLHDEIVGFAKEMEGQAGNVVELWVEPLANHDILNIGEPLGFHSEAVRSAAKARQFMEAHMTSY